jgi:hypothetical protein
MLSERIDNLTPASCLTPRLTVKCFVSPMPHVNTRNITGRKTIESVNHTASPAKVSNRVVGTKFLHTTAANVSEHHRSQ